MAKGTWRIDEFLGIDQSKDGALVNAGSSPDARNFDTTDGNLSVAKGYVKHFDTPIPGAGVIRKLIVMKLFSRLVFGVLAIADDGLLHLYAYDPSVPEWDDIHTWPEGVTGVSIDVLQCNIGNYDYVLIATGESQMVKWDGITNTAELFGSVDIVLETTVSAYDASTKVVTLAGAISADVAKRIRQAGIVIADVTHQAAKVDESAKKVTLSNKPSVEPAAGDEVKVRGGLSDAKVGYLAMHYSRLFSAGDPDNPSRLYYSQIPGDGRSIEDWSSDEITGSPNTGGGFVEIGDTIGDPIVGIAALSTQLLIFKRYSIYRLLGDQPSRYTIERVEATIERFAHSSVVQHADMAYYMTPAGLHYFNNVTVQPMSNARYIRDFIAGSSVSRSKSTVAKDVLYFSVYTGDDAEADYDNAIITYDTRRSTYMVRDGFNVADLECVDGVIYMINDGRYVYRFNEGPDYDGGPISAYWYTPRTDLKDRFTGKKLDGLALRGEGETDLTALLLETYGGTQVRYERKLMTDPREVLYFWPEVAEADTFQFKFANEAGSRFSLHGGMEVDMTFNSRRKRK